jgi:S-DNA-T family DNA segregation ATPase FtsK/SpoIIIE
MSFPLGSLAGDGANEAAAPAEKVYKRQPRKAAAAPPPSSNPLLTPLWLMLGALGWLLLVTAMVTHNVTDAAFSVSGNPGLYANRVGALGAWVSDVLLYLFGYSAWWLPVVGLRQWLSALARLLRHEAPTAPSQVWRVRAFWALGLLLLIFASCALEWTRLYGWEHRLPGPAGGVLGYVLGPVSMKWLGFAGSGVIWIVGLLAGMQLALSFSWLRLAEQLGTFIDQKRERSIERREVKEDKKVGVRAKQERAQVAEVERQVVVEHEPIVIEAPIVEVPKSTRVAKERQQTLFTDASDGKLPQVDLLDAAPPPQQMVTPESLEMTSRMIEKKLRDFGVEVRVVAASPGPVITRYEIEPATGVKGSQIVNLAKDLARSLSLTSIRVVETIPGKNFMALELPNARRQTIRLSEILGSQVYADAPSLLTMALGKDIIGAPVVADLGKMPHCLVAGTTGSGKSVGINAMILSLLYKAEARDVRLIMIDPKMLEMSVYEGIPHLLAPVVTDMKQAANALNWCVGEMERRYKLMSKMGVRNLAGYNKKIDDATARGESIPNPFSLSAENPDGAEPLERMPFVVVVIDELADLMMVVGKKIEELIARLAQKARAAGIHLILATQRPSVDVITGLIKANIPTRLSFQVSSKIDSRTILDQMGAEALLGMGDMLYMASGTGLPVRVHGAFVSDDEVHRVVQYLKDKGGEPNYIEGILEGGVLEGEGGEAPAPGESAGEADPMYDQAVAIVLQHRRASISLVQRHLRIGYNRAARLLEQMEKSGLVSSMATNGNRDLIIPKRDE